LAKKNKTKYICNNCGSIFASWSGRCMQCSEWNTIIEQIDVISGGARSNAGSKLQPITIKQSITQDNKRLASGIPEFDTVLGGGIVAGSVNLIAGQPGIGKSTLLLQLAYALSSKVKVLYVSGEESAHQIGLRAQRLGASNDKLNIVTSNSADNIAATIAAGEAQMVVVDSIQTLACQDISSAAGTVSQITNSSQLITSAAKASNTAVIIVGHVTKEGYIAGPKVLEHAVDVVLQLEGDRYGGFKLLRAIKNRFGPTTETGIFEMNDKGMMPVKNPSAALLSERQVSDGSIVLATMEGTRPLLVEVQALVNRTSFGYPKRAASGFDLNRLNLLIAMLERRSKLKLSESDIYINIVGGMQIKDPAADLAICLAIGSAAKGYQLNKNLAVFGETGLSGEIRHASYAERRIAEAKKLGFSGAIGPKSQPTVKIAGLYAVSDVRSALNQFLDK